MGVSMHLSKKVVFNIFLILLLIFMFIFPIPTIKGATSGLLLWFNTILPTLLPFMIVSNIIIKLNITDYICVIFNPLFKRLFAVSKNGCYPIVMGLMSGFPIGAKTSADMVNSGKISKSEGQYLMSLCNNASITYISSYIVISTLKIPSLQYPILAIIFISTFLSSFLSKKIYHLKWESNSNSSQNSNTTKETKETKKKKPFDFHDVFDLSIMDGFEVITKVGGYIILFSIIAHIIILITSADYLTLPPILSESIKYLRLLLVGTLEITTGTYLIGISKLTLPTKLILITMITSFGGLSSLAQTYSVINQSNLSIKLYIKTKLMNAGIAFIISYLYILIFH